MVRGQGFVVAACVLAGSVLTGSARAQESAAPPASSEECRIVVLNLVGRGLPKGDEDLPAILTDTLAAEVGASSGCGVVSQADIVAMLDYEKQKAVCTDGSDSCLAEVGQAMGANRVVAGTVGKLGSETILTARLMDVKKGTVEARAEQSVSGTSELRRAAKNVGRRLFGKGDLPFDEADDAPLEKDKPLPGLFWVGGGVLGLGVATAVVGGVLAALGNEQLGNANETDKQRIQQEGLVSLGVAAAGGVVALAGAGLIAVAIME